MTVIAHESAVEIDTRLAAPAPTCQHCDRPVHWGRTEQGFAGFVHDETNTAACPSGPSTSSMVTARA